MIKKFLLICVLIAGVLYALHFLTSSQTKPVKNPVTPHTEDSLKQSMTITLGGNDIELKTHPNIQTYLLAHKDELNKLGDEYDEINHRRQEIMASRMASQSGNAKFIDEIVGKGETVGCGDEVEVEYNIISEDTSLKPTQKTILLGTGHPLGGWESAILGMRQGGKRHVIAAMALVEPHTMAFSGYRDQNGLLHFRVMVLSIKKSDKKMDSKAC